LSGLGAPSSALTAAAPAVIAAMTAAEAAQRALTMAVRRRRSRRCSPVSAVGRMIPSGWIDSWDSSIRRR